MVFKKKDKRIHEKEEKKEETKKRIVLEAEWILGERASACRRLATALRVVDEERDSEPWAQTTTYC